MIKIKYRLNNKSEWQILEINRSVFERSDTHCDEWTSQEIRECFYAIIPDDDYEDVFDGIEFAAGDYWENVVMPIYNKYVKV